MEGMIGRSRVLYAREMTRFTAGDDDDEYLKYGYGGVTLLSFDARRVSDRMIQTNNG